MKLVVAAALGCLLLAGSAPASEPVTVAAKPFVSMAPATLLVDVIVEPDARNRVLSVVTESDDFYTLSEVELNGDHAARKQKFTIRNLPPGEYVVQARIKRADDSERIAQARALVTGF